MVLQGICAGNLSGPSHVRLVCNSAVSADTLSSMLSVAGMVIFYDHPLVPSHLESSLRHVQQHEVQLLLRVRLLPLQQSQEQDLDHQHRQLIAVEEIPFKNTARQDLQHSLQL